MDQDLIDLISACRGAEIDPDVRARLVERLGRDEAFQQAFVDEIRMLGMLKAVQSMEPRWLRIQDELGWGPKPPAASGSKERDEEIIRQIRETLPRASTGRRAWRVAAVAAVLLLAGASYKYWSRAPGGAPVAAGPYAVVDVERGLAMIVALDGVRWDDEGGAAPHPSEGDVLAPGRLQIRSGRVTLSMLNGVVLIVEGPADLDLVSIDRVVCRRGRLWSRTPKGAEGLVISSPTAAVIDLGTEIGLNVETSGRSRLKVFEGHAQAVMYTGSDNENLSRLVGTNRGLQFDPKAGKITDLQGSEGFASPLDLPTPSLELDPSYPSAVLGSRPWGYWRFESLQGGAVANEVAGRPALLATGPVRQSVSDTPAGNRTAVFGPGEDLQYLALDGLWEPTPYPGYAVELWFVPESIDHSALVSMPSPSGTNHHRFFLEMGSRNRHALHPPATVRFLDRWPPATGGGHNLYSRRPYVPYRWHHLVGQMNAGRMELYLDGEPTRSLQADSGHPTAPCQVLLGRLSTVPVRQRPEKDHWLFNRGFVGRLDEVAIYDHPLSVDEIRRHRLLATQRVVKGPPAVPGRAEARPDPRSAPSHEIPEE